jgi:cytochrome c oxidase assembly protein subunit 15
MPLDFSDSFRRDQPIDRMDAVPVRSPARLAVAAWLFLVCGMILVMIGLGGATRLTGSGLSIMEWAPFRGTLPPLSDAEWQRLFTLYQKIPQYTLVNDGFGVEGFKQIFWLEYLHRLWGRLIGFAFFLPLLWFWARGVFARGQELRWLRLRLLGLLLLGGAQGGVGWFMVASGFEVDSTAVSPYRLVVHLMLALSLYAAILWTGLEVIRPGRSPEANTRIARRMLSATCMMVALTILAGGFVAGTRAGLSYNTFPLMDGQWVPSGYAQLTPFWRNLAENIAAVQFDHRLLATCTAILTAGTVIVGLASGLPAAWLYALAAAVATQYALGIVTLLAVPDLGHLPAGLGTAHQSVAVLVLTAALVALHGARRAFMRPA